MLKEMTGRDGICPQSMVFWKGGRAEDTEPECEPDSPASRFSDRSRGTRLHIVSLRPRGSDGFVQRLDFLCRPGDEGRPRVDDGLAAGSAEVQPVPDLNPEWRKQGTSHFGSSSEGKRADSGPHPFTWICQ